MGRIADWFQPTKGDLMTKTEAMRIAKSESLMRPQGSGWIICKRLGDDWIETHEMSHSAACCRLKEWREERAAQLCLRDGGSGNAARMTLLAIVLICLPGCLSLGLTPGYQEQHPNLLREARHPYTEPLCCQRCRRFD